MKAKDLFIEWLRDKILQNPAEPAANTWQEISNGLDLEESWEAINDELDLDNVWQKLNKQLDHYHYLHRYEKVSNGISAVAVLLLLVILIISGPASEKKSHIQANEKQEAPLLTAAENNAYSNESLPTSPTSSKLDIGPGEQDQLSPISGGRETASSGQQVTEASKKEEEPSLPLFPSQVGPEEADVHLGAVVMAPGEGAAEESMGTGRELARIASQAPELFSVFKDPSEGIMEKGEKHVEIACPSPDVYPRTYLGIGSAFKLSGLLNSKTWHAMERSSLLSSAPVWQQDIYLLYGFRIAPSLYLQADLYLRDKVGQQYNEYREGVYGSFRDELSYQSLGVSLSRVQKQVAYGKMPVFARWIGGFYGGKLLSAKEASVAGTADRTAEYSRFHVGVLAGYEYDVFLQRQLMLSYGLQSRIDVLNIYSGTGNIPASFRKTRAFSLGFNVSVKYMIKK